MYSNAPAIDGTISDSSIVVGNSGIEGDGVIVGLEVGVGFTEVLVEGLADGEAEVDVEGLGLESLTVWGAISG